MFQYKLPSNLTYGYDFRETSAASHAVVVEKVKKADFGQDKDYTGLLLPTAMPHAHRELTCLSEYVSCINQRNQCPTPLIS